MISLKSFSFSNFQDPILCFLQDRYNDTGINAKKNYKNFEKFLTQYETYHSRRSFIRDYLWGDFQM